MQVRQNLSASDGSRPFQGAGNFSEYLSKEAAEAPDTPASQLGLQCLRFDGFSRLEILILRFSHCSVGLQRSVALTEQCS